MLRKKPVATFSIAAADVASGEVGVAVASKFLAVGAVVPWAAAGAGAVATQAHANASFGPIGIGLMREHRSAAEALALLISGDDDPDRRQVGLVDARGGSAAHTGSGCPDWAGHFVGPGFACQGNLLAGAEVVAAMARTFQSSTGPLAERMSAALRAGEAAGGDHRGRQSAAIYVARDKGGYLGLSDVHVDLRVDDHPEPLQELSRLLGLQDLYFGSSPTEDKRALTGPLLRELKQIMRADGYRGTLDDTWTDEVRQAVEAFIGIRNLEERVDLAARTIDLPALLLLRSLDASRR
jgi:uncharacterized Ntn-hydrolase superfamily protein